MPTTELILNPLVVKSLIKSARHRFYVYILHRPDGRPFYVGKGIGERVLQHVAEARNPARLTHKLNVIRSIQRSGASIGYLIDSFHETESAAHSRERDLIRLIGRHDLGAGPLTNQTDGGEGTSNPSEASKERHRQSLAGLEAEDPERRVANLYMRSLLAVESNPLKTSKFKTTALRRNRNSFPMSRRQAAALAASAIANQILLKPSCLIPRWMSFDGIELVIENGVGCDMLVSGMVTIDDATPGREVLRLTDAGFAFLTSELNPAKLIDAGVLEPKDGQRES